MPVLEPENNTVWRIFQTLLTQARFGGLGGYVGLDYGPLEFLFRAHQVPEGEWVFYMEKIDVLSSIALNYYKPKPVEKKKT